MWLTSKTVLPLAACLLTLLSLVTAKSAESKNTQKLSRAHFAFSLDLYKQLVDSITDGDSEDVNAAVGKNLVYSPFSVNSVLSMLFLGTRSATNSSQQLRASLHLNGMSYVDVHNAFKSVSRVFEDKYYAHKVRAANALFVQEGVAVSAPYERALREFYGAEVETLDFRNADPEQTMGVVNDWVNDVTEGQIPALMDAPPAKDAKLVLANAMAMEAKWMQPFSAADTFEKGLFFLPGNQR